MRPLRILAVDDEPPALDDLSYLLREDGRVGRVLTAGSGAAALRMLEAEPVDAVFLDIRMPGLDGLDLVRVLSRFAQPPLFVFVTAYEDFAVDAFALKACDYLLKPVGAERLAEAVRRVAALLDAGREGSGPPAARQAAAPDPGPERIPVDLGGVTRFVSRDDVAYVEASGDYVRLHTAGQSPLVRVPLAALADSWEQHGFLRIHRSFLVSLRHVEELRSDAGHWTVRVAGTELPVSRRHTRQLRDILVRWTPTPGADPS
jgi:DNA-binding LytR/AlgR family response regulator